MILSWEQPPRETSALATSNPPSTRLSLLGSWGFWTTQGVVLFPTPVPSQPHMPQAVALC